VNDNVDRMFTEPVVYMSLGSCARLAEKRLLASSCLSVHPHATTPFTKDGFS